ncbi:hypothetical protein [Formosa sp. A9]|uniref:hypothetical protein n=1 Tax=Formosa sp. A9 TaxID=3442641 RepID=UPI003EBA2EA4
MNALTSILNILPLPNTNKTCFALFVVVLGFTGNCIWAQQSPSIPNSLVDNITKNALNYLQESVYLQTSKGIYETGEDLWFKAYVLNSQYLIPSDLSNTLYVQLVEDQTDVAVWQERYSIEKGFVNGHVFIQDTLKSGTYRLEALTSESFYKNTQDFKSARKLIIVDRISDFAKDSITKTNEIDFDFKLFPEGGHLVSGIQSTVAFKAIDAKGQPKTISGTLLENDKPLLDFKSTHAGMGAFIFTPDITKTYRITLNDSLGQKTVSLPKIEPQGQVMQLVTNSNEAITLKISKSPGLETEMIYVRVQVRGVVYTIAKTLLDEAQIVSIPVNDMPQGIAEITLFNQDLQPVAERLVFVKQYQKLHIKTVLDKSEYLTKEQVKLNIKVVDQNGNPQIAHLGLSVYDAMYNNPNDTKTIASHFLLTEELKGNLHDPSYYFKDENENRKQALNLLLLTQGWRAYTWGEQNLKQLDIKRQLAVKDTLIGKIHASKQKDRALLSQQYVIAFTAEDSGKNLIEVDSIGRFTVLPEYISQANGGYLYLKLLQNDPNKNMSIAIHDPTFKTINQIKKQKTFIYPINFNSKLLELKPEENYTSYKDMNQLDEVMLTAKKERVFRDKYMGTLDSLAKLDVTIDYLCKNGVLNCIKHAASGKIPIPGNTYDYYVGREIQQVIYKEQIKKNFTEEELLKLFNVSCVKGVYIQKVFYEPVYDLDEQINGFPDYRNTLYWKPDIITDTNGQAQITFYCSDINTKFLGAIEGINGSGALGREEFEFFVKKR